MNEENIHTLLSVPLEKDALEIGRYDLQLHTGNTCSVGQHPYRTKEIKSKGNIYLNGRYCRPRLKNEVYMHMGVVCCDIIPRMIISSALHRSFVHA